MMFLVKQILFYSIIVKFCLCDILDKGYLS
jgi:hypothetical protein